MEEITLRNQRQRKEVLENRVNAANVVKRHREKQLPMSSLLLLPSSFCEVFGVSREAHSKASPHPLFQKKGPFAGMQEDAIIFETCNVGLRETAFFSDVDRDLVCRRSASTDVLGRGRRSPPPFRSRADVDVAGNEEKETGGRKDPPVVVRSYRVYENDGYVVK
jgi:hypothetical protein